MRARETHEVRLWRNDEQSYVSLKFDSPVEAAAFAADRREWRRGKGMGPVEIITPAQAQTQEAA